MKTLQRLASLSVVPWLVTSVGVGLIGAWAHRTAVEPCSPGDDQERYLAANRLLHELLDVSRRLSSGLDPVSLSNSLLHDCLAGRPDGRGELLVRTQDGAFETLSGQGGVAGGEPSDVVVARCWATGKPAQGHIDVAPPATMRYALPLRVGSRLVGVVALDIAGEINDGELGDLQELMDRRALALDTALLFDEIRRVATTEERHRLAREIHDGVAQEIASLGYLVDDLAVVPAHTRAARIQELRDGLTHVVDDLRLSIFDLRSDVSQSRGLGLVLSEYLRGIGLHSPLTVHLSIDETSERLRPAVEEELLRIVQEAVTNARRHSGAAQLWVTCRLGPPTVEIVVEDDGRGISRARNRRGFGLNIMRERAERIGASFGVVDRPGGGTRIFVRLQAASGASPAPGDSPHPSTAPQPHEQTVQEVTHG